jgi:flagellar basal body P-ring protein FlgI
MASSTSGVGDTPTVERELSKKAQEYTDELVRIEREMYTDLEQIEKIIADKEDKYIAEFSAGGNILIGYDLMEGTKKEKKAHLFSG